MIDGPQRGPLPADQASFVSLSASNVELVTLKNSEQPGRGWIPRLVETEGRDTDVNVELGRLKVAAAQECDLVENDVRAITVEGNRLRLHVGNFAYATIRLMGGAQAPIGVAQATAKAASDSEISLEWPAVAGAAGYGIYRSDDPKDPPTAYTLAARAVKNSFTGAGLNLDTTYYYHVASVSRDGLQSRPSPQISAHTSAVNRTAPPPVADLGTVRLAKDTLVVYWNKSTAPDVARYLVYRSETADFPASLQPVGK